MLKQSLLLVSCALVFMACDIKLEKEKEENPKNKPDIGQKITPQELPKLEGSYLSPGASLTIYSDQSFVLKSKNSVTMTQKLSNNRTEISEATCTISYHGTLDAFKNKAGKYLSLQVQDADVTEVVEVTSSAPVHPEDVCHEFANELELQDSVSLPYTNSSDTLWLTQSVNFKATSSDSFTLSDENKMFGWFFGREEARVDVSALLLPLIAGQYQGTKREMLLDDSFRQVLVDEARCGFSVKAEEVELYLIEGQFYLGTVSRVGVVLSDDYKEGFVCDDLQNQWKDLNVGYGRPFSLSGEEFRDGKTLYHAFRIHFTNDSEGPFDTLIERKK